MVTGGTQFDDTDQPPGDVRADTPPYKNPVPITYFGSAWATLGLMRCVPKPPVDKDRGQPTTPAEQFKAPGAMVSRPQAGDHADCSSRLHAHPASR